MRGVAYAVTVAASAVGPLLLAVGHGRLRSYQPVALTLTVLPLVLAVATMIVREPHEVETPRWGTASGESPSVTQPDHAPARCRDKGS